MTGRSFFAAAAIAASLSGAACAPLRVHAFTERNTDFARFRTYAFAPADRSTGDPRLDGNRFFEERVHAALDKGLAARGLERTDARRADLLVHYHARVTQELEIPEAERTDCVTGTSAGGVDLPHHCQPSVYESGTLMVDLVDARTRRLLWRGWAEGSLDGVLSDQAWMNQRVDDSIARILDKLPRRL